MIVGCNVNKHRRLYSLVALLEKNSHLSGSAEAEVKNIKMLKI